MSDTATFLFTDIEGSTQLWEQNPGGMSVALAYHDALIAETISKQNGTIFKTLGDGVCAVFDSASDALTSALTIQRQLYQEAMRPKSGILRLLVRMGLHTGTVERRADDYFGATVNRVARLMNAAHGGQILLSADTQAILTTSIELRDLELRDIGHHNLRDVSEPLHIYQALSSDFPANLTPIRSLSPRATNLPNPLTSIVGRENEATDICRRLRQPNVRLLTLIGAGGIGKTRLSIQAGNLLLDEYEDGIFFIPLAALHQRDTVIQRLAQILSLQSETTLDGLDAVQDFLRTRQALLIFDNFEHILDTAPLVADLLTSGARVKVLATSREALMVYGEHRYAVVPLSIPPIDQPLETAAQSPAVMLFTDRIRAIQEDFTLSKSNTADVIAICRQLEGLPLALELAAARIHDMTLTEIAAGLSERMALLVQGFRNLPPRQQTMRNAIEWSYQLLTPDEQRAFARLAVFEGQFLTSSAHALIDPALLTALKNKSLVQQPVDGRYSMLAVLRDFALEKLTAFGALKMTYDQHGSHYRDWLEAIQDHLNGRDQAIWFGWLQVEQDNLHVALDRFFKRDEIENVARIVAILWRYWATQSMFTEAERWFNRLIAFADTLPALIRARVMQGAGRMALLSDQPARALTLQQTSLSLFHSLQQTPEQAAVLLSLGETEVIQRHHEMAEHYLGASLSLFRYLDDPAGIGRSLNNLGKIATQRGSFEIAEPLLRESVALARSHGSPEGLALAYYELAGVLRAQSKFAEAETYYRESVTLYRELNFPVGVAAMRYNVGFALQGQSKHDTAREHFFDALKMLQPLQEDYSTAECLVGVAAIYLQSGDLPACIKTLSAATRVLISASGEITLDYADQVHYDRIIAAAKQASIGDDSGWDKAWTAGQITPLTQIVHEILERELAAHVSA